MKSVYIVMRCSPCISILQMSGEYHDFCIWRQPLEQRNSKRNAKLILKIKISANQEIMAYKGFLEAVILR
ncbi:MAG: hypothetical protein Q7J12_08595 [Syntrophales bacterium]|nr:hypothetical protein [Syntrophales bacterium]